MMAMLANENESPCLSQFNSTLSRLIKHPPILKLCKTILSNIVRDSNNPKFQSLNDTKLASKCNSDEYVYLSQYLKLIGFERKMNINSSSECRWIFNAKTNSTQLMNKYLNMIHSQINASKQQMAHSQMATVYPPKMGDLSTQNAQKWALSQRSIDNFHSGSSWGNYFVVLIFYNLLPFQVSIHWINRMGKERKEGTLVESGKSVTIFAQLNHPHVVKRCGNAMYGINDEYLIGYNAHTRGISNNGYHVIFIGNIKGNIVQNKALELIKNAAEDKRVKPRMGPAPSPPRPEDRKGKFYGGR